MKLRILSVVVLLLAAAWCAWGGEVLRDSEGRVLVPVAKLKCVPRYEIKSLYATVCRVAGTSDAHVLVITVTFIHRNSFAQDIRVAVDMAPGGNNGFLEGTTGGTVVEKVKPNTIATARVVYKYAYKGDTTWLPVITFTTHFAKLPE